MNREQKYQQRLLAIALRYTGTGTPRVTAKGGGEIAEKILEQARQHHIPIREDRELAPILAQVPLGKEIPENLYLAVAEVLAFAYRLSEESQEYQPEPPPSGVPGQSIDKSNPL